MGLQLSIDQIPDDTQEPVEVERMETLVETQSACGAALDILNELLLFDKLESGALVLNKLTVPVPELVEDSIKMFSVQTREKSIELLITNNDEGMLPPTRSSMLQRTGTPAYQISAAFLLLYDTDEITVDKNKVVQVIRNVVSNAIKFTPSQGRIQINIKFVPDVQSPKRERTTRIRTIRYNQNRVIPTDSDRGGESDIEMNMSVRSQVSVAGNIRQVLGELVIEIKDNGAGISEENQRRLFKEVVQFNPELLQNGGGSGLGMCISKSIMDMHGGSISVHSAGEGRGSLFTLRLPMVRLVCDDEPSSVYTPTPSSRQPSVRPQQLSQKASVSFGSGPPAISGGVHTGVSTEGSELPASSKLLSLTNSVKGIRHSVPERVLRFLVVDDSSLNRKMLCRLLRNHGHECDEAEDGVQAVSTITAVLSTQRAVQSKSHYEIKEAEESGGYRSSFNVVRENVFDMILMDFM